MIVVLALKTNRIGQSFLPCPFRALFFDFSPCFVLRAPGDLAGVVGQFLWRAEVVALVPRQYVYRQRLRGVRPQWVLVDVVDTSLSFLDPLVVGSNPTRPPYCYIKTAGLILGVNRLFCVFNLSGVGIPATG